ncbi:MAG: efflux RND transporter periplasmic adaptor subunit [Verrucomicrobiales bacterium]
MTVAKVDVARSTTFIGQLDSPENVDVRARVESFLDKMLFTEGLEVKAGDPLFELVKQPYEEKLAAAKAALAEANAALAKSKLDVSRLRPLAQQNAVPQRELDAALTALEVNEANVAAAEARVKTADLDLGYCDIRAPLSGRIGAKEVAIGSLVGKGEPTLLATISQIDPIWFYCSISEVDFLQAERLARSAGRKMGELPVTLILADGTEHPQQGKWIFMDRVVDPTTATIRARAEFPNPDRQLRPGMFARARVSLPAGEGNILVPERAVTELQGKNFVWVVDTQNKVTQRPVHVAPIRIGSDAVVLEGMQPGERVVAEGVQKLREGGLVEPVTFERSAEAASAPAAAPPSGPAPEKPEPKTSEE